MKIEDHVGGSQSVSDSQTVMPRDDDEFKIKGRLRGTDPQPHADYHRKSPFEARRDFSEWRSAAAHAPVEPFGKTETKLDYVLKHTSAEIIERRLRTRDLLWLGEVHSPRPRLDSPARHSSE